EEAAGSLHVERVEALEERGVRRRDELAGLVAASLGDEEWRSAESGAQLQRLGALAPGEFQRPREAFERLIRVGWLCGERNLAAEAVNLRLIKELPTMRGGVQGGGERFRGSLLLARAEARFAEQPEVV